MIGKQLDLFGGPPMPPKKIREEDEATKPTVIENEELATPGPSPTAEATVLISEAPVLSAHLSVAEEAGQPVDSLVDSQKVFVQMPTAFSGQVILTTGHFANVVEDSGHTIGEEETPQLSAVEQTFDLHSKDIQMSVEPVCIQQEHEDALSILDEKAIGEASVDVIQEPAFLLAAEEIEETETFPDESEQPHMDEVPNVQENPKQDTTAASGVHIPDDTKLYSRQYYTMRETAAMFNVNQSLLRFWENEFDILKPKKNRKGDRYFRPDDIRNLEMIYHLLRVRKFTIEGAKEYIKSRSRSLETFEMVQRLEKLKLFLQELKTMV